MGCKECLVFFFQAEDGIRDFCLSRGLGDVYKRQAYDKAFNFYYRENIELLEELGLEINYFSPLEDVSVPNADYILSLIHISEPTRQAEISYAVFCLKKKK
ncbi:cobyrinic acid a,c-diamide synthase [Clostridioides difficile]|nr:cobyrinic acid a,c-diamide synthase [Clostridioides difficile]